MSRSFVTGDTHGTFERFSSSSWETGKHLTKDDVLLVCGDFGLLFANQPTDSALYWKDWLTNKPWTTCFIDGNHENFPQLAELPTIQKFGGPVGQVTSSIFHLRRGEIYTINGKIFFCYGGAESIDKFERIEGVSWWPEEIPTKADETRALTNLDKHQHQVDVVLTHTLPRALILNINKTWQRKSMDPTTRFLDHIYSTVAFSYWFCGHFHTGKQNERVTMLYHGILEIK